MHAKTTVALALLLALLAGFYYVYEIRLGPQRERAEAEKGRLFTLEAKDVEGLVLRRGAETVRLKREGEGWVLLEPVRARAEARAVDALVSSLTSARVEREIESNPATLADFGLDPPAAEVTLTARGQEHGLRLGAKTPTGIWVYAQARGKPPVFLLSDLILRDAQKTPDELRDRTVLAFEVKDVGALEIEAHGQVMRAERIAGEGWRIARPIAVKADADRIIGLLDKLNAARIKAFVDEAPKSTAAYGLTDPVRVTLWMGQGKDRTAKTLRLGRADPKAKGVYALRGGEPTVFLVEEEIWKAVPLTVTALRDKIVMAYEWGKVERVELESPKGRVTLVKDGQGWRLTAPLAVKADNGAASELLFALTDLRAKEFVTEKPKGLARYGLDRPQVQVTLWEQEAKAPKTLLLAPARGEKGMAYAAVEGQGPVTLVEAKALRDLARSAQELRDRTLFGALDPGAVKTIQLTLGETRMVLERRGGEEWRMVEPRRGKARASRVDDLLFTLRGLKWRETVKAEASDLGLEPPSLAVSLLGGDGKELAALEVGRAEKGDTYVRVPGRPELYAVETTALGGLPEGPDDLAL